MSLLVIDAGNSRCKFTSGGIDASFPQEKVQTCSLDELEFKLQELDGIRFSVVSSVHLASTHKLHSLLKPKLDETQLCWLKADNSPINLDIKNAASLGSDRIAAAFGGFQRANQSCIVIDSGTATTVDYVNEDGVFQGGAIFPGFELSIRALAEQADQLPLIDCNFVIPPETIGNHTVAAIRSGVFWGQIGAVDRMVENIQERFSLPLLYSTGGNGNLIASHSRFDITHLPSLVLEGLWRIGQQKFLG